jgi:hypothetical protein
MQVASFRLSLPPRLSAFGRRGWLDSPPARRIAMAATAAGLVLAAVLPDALANIRLLQVMTPRSRFSRSCSFSRSGGRDRG